MKNGQKIKVNDENGQLEKEGSQRKRVKNVMVRFSEDEFQKVREDAEKVNMKVAEYCRVATLMGQIKIVQSKKIELDQSVMINLYRIGSNLNQLLKYLNQTRSQYLAYEEVLDAIIMIGQLKEVYQQILERLK